MFLDEAKAATLDAAVAGLVDRLVDTGDADAAALCAYTSALHRAWRTVLKLLPVAPTWRVLDVGCGVGILSYELAANLAIRVDAFDLVERYLVEAATLGRELGAVEGFFDPAAAVSFTAGDVTAVPYGDASFDLVVVRELLQFLPDPLVAVRELHRVCRPGGYACVSDTDDQLYLTWPAATPAFDRLFAAVREVQRLRGGDRQTGRKLSTYLRDAGFEVVSVVVLPEAQHQLAETAASERAILVTQLEAARERIVSEGVMTLEAFDADLYSVRATPVTEQFRLNARIVVLGRRPGIGPIEVPAL